ncbi:MAG: PilN domain-containing protein [Candidatus Pacebacteria bacterium]|nr:PilN domain-containing protein [Candidatus Paceibacterota bacterium]
MANLLPSKELTALMHERKRRLGNAIVVLICGICVFGTILTIPSTIALLATRDSTEKRLETTKRLVELQKHAGASAHITATKEKMDILAREEGAVLPHELIERIAPIAPAGVSLTNIVFARGGEDVTLTLTGGATNRTALIAFGDALRSSGLFTEVTIPIESLAQNTDLQFHLSLTLTKTTQ